MRDMAASLLEKLLSQSSFSFLCEEMSCLSQSPQGQQFVTGTLLYFIPLEGTVLILVAELAFHITFPHLKW